MKLPIAMLALVAGLAPAGATDLVRIAQADPDDLMPPAEIATIVRSTGLAPTARPMRRGDVYVVPAVDGYGRALRVVVDGEVGDILSIRPAALEAAAPPRVQRPAYRTWLPPDPYGSARSHPVPPRSVPQARRIPATLAPTRPPVPRPRPSAVPQSARTATAADTPSAAGPRAPATQAPAGGARIAAPATPPPTAPSVTPPAAPAAASPNDPPPMVPVAPLE